MAKKRKKYFLREREISKFLFSILILVVFGSIFGQSFYAQFIKEIDDFVLVAYGYGGGGGNDYNLPPPPPPPTPPPPPPPPPQEVLPPPPPIDELPSSPPTEDLEYPTLISIYPEVVNAGDLEFMLNIKGLYFIPESEVKINGSTREAQYVSSKELTVLVLAEDVVNAGTLKITVFNPEPTDEGMTSNVKILTVNNLIPTIESIYPISAIRGNSDIILTVNGTGFSPSSIINWDDSAILKTTYDSDTQLKGIITNSVAITPGEHEITVFNPSPSEWTSNIQIFSIIINPPIKETLNKIDFRLIIVILLVLISTTLFTIERNL